MFANWIHHREDLDERTCSEEAPGNSHQQKDNQANMFRHRWSFRTQLCQCSQDTTQHEHQKVTITGLPKNRINITLILYLCQHIGQVVKWQKLYRDRESLRDRPAAL